MPIGVVVQYGSAEGIFKVNIKGYNQFSDYDRAIFDEKYTILYVS